jgi:hypothetical protein
LSRFLEKKLEEVQEHSKNLKERNKAVQTYLEQKGRMPMVRVDNGELIIGAPIKPDGTISIDTFNRLFPNATVFLFKRNRSNVWTEYVVEYIL